MIAKVSVKGQTVIPEAIREMARIRPGDQLDVGYCGGLIVMRKSMPVARSNKPTRWPTGNPQPGR